MSATHPVSRDSRSEAAAPTPSTAQHNDSTPPGVGSIGEDDQTRLINALKDSDYKLSRSLLESLSGKALTDSVNARYGVLTTLHRALQNGFYDLVPKLIEYAADKNEFVATPDGLGDTALHVAASPSGASNAATVVEAIRELVKHATDKNEYITTRGFSGRTALHLAASPSGTSSAATAVEVIRELVKHATDQNEYITTRDCLGWTALHYAASGEYIQPMETLLALSDNRKNYVNLKDGNGRTPLHRAAISDSGNIAALLLKSGADAEIRDKYGKTAWDIACMEGEEEKFKTPSLLTQTLRRWPKSINVRKEFRENQEARRPYLRSREPSCTVLNPKLEGGDQSFKFLSLVIPYIYVDKRRVLHEREVEVENDNSLKEKRICLEWHMPTTLDEYCNPSLSEGVLDARNKDQVLGRYEKKKKISASAPPRDGNGHHRELLNELLILVRGHIRKFGRFVNSQISIELKRKGEAEKNAGGTKGENTTAAGRIKATGGGQLRENVVFVHQAWVWMIDKEVIMTRLLPDVWRSDDIRWEIRLQDQARGIAYLLIEAVRRLERPAVGLEGSLLRTYENALVIISEEDLFHQISDLREEASMIKSVLAEQEEVWTEFMRLMGPNKEQGHHSSTGDSMSDKVSESGSSITEQDSLWGNLRQLQTQFDKYKRRIRKLEEDAERVQQNISTMLDLKQKHAAMREAHSAAVLGATVFGFTVITVIYAPLAFVAALFALPIDKFNEGKDMNGTDGVYSSSYIGKWSVATEFASIAITLIAMWAGLRFAGLHVWGQRGLREYIRQKVDAICKEEKSEDTDGEEENNAEEGEAQPRAYGGQVTKETDSST
ncbi:hypothetical protein EKO27_g6936 [Xylaria grammica]|uniref:Uncharacterized protein n=1 Tax=Xylaria grammica TaxID=363999 RepID=A0A439D187_9PEZI|nr:hypothetical protein EKO27_g6936 [Xylaria grammica]